MENAFDNSELGTPPVSASRRLAPEDLRVGAFVVVVASVHEVWPAGFVDEITGQVRRPVMVECLMCASGDPLRVVGVCLPFVQVENAQGVLSALDVRQQRLASVPDDYGLEAFTRPRTDTDARGE